nr:PEPxxWA-CTERM sorting domain-containing protein [Polymorphobacter sp.]
MIDPRLTLRGTAALLGLALAMAAGPAHATYMTRLEIRSAFPNYIQFTEISMLDNAGVNRALPAHGGLATATSSLGPDYTPDRVNNGSITDLYVSATPGGGEKLTITLGGRYYIQTLVFNTRTDCCKDRDIYNYDLFDGDTIVFSDQLAMQGVNRRIISFPGPLPPPPGVPEPASWALMIAGFGAVGGLLRRRRHNPLATVLAS